MQNSITSLDIVFSLLDHLVQIDQKHMPINQNDILWYLCKVQIDCLPSLSEPKRCTNVLLLFFVSFSRSVTVCTIMSLCVKFRVVL